MLLMSAFSDYVGINLGGIIYPASFQQILFHRCYFYQQRFFHEILKKRLYEISGSGKGV